MSFWRRRNQLVDVFQSRGEPRGVVALIHGGFWRAEYGSDLMRDDAHDLASRGYTVGNLAYRRVGEAGGGWPGTCDDVVAGLRALIDAQGPLTAVVGHSAGGQLALWASKEIEPRPLVVVSVAGVVDLARADYLQIGAGATAAFVGPSLVALAAADPVQRLPLGCKTVLVSTPNDMIVPYVLSESYVRAATAAGDDVELIAVDGDHFSVLDPSTATWAAVVDAIDASV